MSTEIKLKDSYTYIHLYRYLKDDLIESAFLDRMIKFNSLDAIEKRKKKANIEKIPRGFLYKRYHLDILTVARRYKIGIFIVCYGSIIRMRRDMGI